MKVQFNDAVSRVQGLDSFFYLLNQYTGVTTSIPATCIKVANDFTVEFNVIDVLHVHDHARLGVVVLGAQLDASGTQVDSRAEGDGDAGLHLHIHLVEGRDALLGDDVRADS